MPGSITRRSECITAVIVLASTGADSAAESASADSVTFAGMEERNQRKMWNIRLSPDVKLFKDRSIADHSPIIRRSFAKHMVRYLGALTRCNCNLFETCIKHA